MRALQHTSQRTSKKFLPLNKGVKRLRPALTLTLLLLFSSNPKRNTNHTPQRHSLSPGTHSVQLDNVCRRKPLISRANSGAVCWGSWLSTVTRPWAERLRFFSRQDWLWVARGTGGLSDQSSPSSAQVKNSWSYTYIPPYVCIERCLITHQGQTHVYILNSRARTAAEMKRW